MANAILTIEGGRAFELIANPDFRGAMINYGIYEVVRPNWIIFRTRYCDSGCFWTEDFPTIREGLQHRLAQFLLEEERDRANQKKFQEFENGA